MSSVSHPLVVRRALDLVESRGEAVTVNELCHAVGVSERTLRNAFHEVHGLSPKRYLIRRGLELAHDALQHAHGARGAVTQVATECGFYELGRFASAYRQLYGELPSATLREAAMSELRTRHVHGGTAHRLSGSATETHARGT